MGRKAKYSYEQKVQACEDYLNGKKSSSQIAAELSMSENGQRVIREWAHQYETNGVEFFLPKKHNAKYSKELKLQIVQEYLNGEGSFEQLANKYGIAQDTTVRQWVIKYTVLLLC